MCINGVQWLETVLIFLNIFLASLRKFDVCFDYCWCHCAGAAPMKQNFTISKTCLQSNILMCSGQSSENIVLDWTPCVDTLCRLDNLCWVLSIISWYTFVLSFVNLFLFPGREERKRQHSDDSSDGSKVIASCSNLLSLIFVNWFISCSWKDVLCHYLFISVAIYVFGLSNIFIGQILYEHVEFL